MPVRDRGRLVALDGLRGIAAAVVVVHHCLLTIPGPAAAYTRKGTNDLASAVLAYTPLHLAWAGAEAVIVFFVLSGFVLVLPTARWQWPDWVSYYPRRVVRLYAPVLVAVLLSVVWAVLATRDDSRHASWWTNRHVGPTVDRVLGDAALLGDPGDINTVLWSLRWEVLFSLLLPLYAWVAWRARRSPVMWWLVGLALVVVVVAPLPFARERFYLSAFAVGALLAVRTLAAPSSRALRVAAWVAVALALSARWTIKGGLQTGLLDPNAVLDPLADVLVIAGGAGAVALTAATSPRFFRAPVVEWLGSRSFSLYLVHEPVVVSFAVLMPTAPRWLPIAVAVPLALALTEVFYRVVERPTIGLARAVGRATRPGAPRRAVDVAPTGQAPADALEVGGPVHALDRAIDLRAFEGSAEGGPGAGHGTPVDPADERAHERARHVRPGQAEVGTPSGGVRRE